MGNQIMPTVAFRVPLSDYLKIVALKEQREQAKGCKVYMSDVMRELVSLGLEKEQFNGIIDEVLIHTEMLSADEINEIYHEVADGLKGLGLV